MILEASRKILKRWVAEQVAALLAGQPLQRGLRCHTLPGTQEEALEGVSAPASDAGQDEDPAPAESASVAEAVHQEEVPAAAQSPEPVLAPPDLESSQANGSSSIRMFGGATVNDQPYVLSYDSTACSLTFALNSRMSILASQLKLVFSCRWNNLAMTASS